MPPPTIMPMLLSPSASETESDESTDEHEHDPTLLLAAGTQSRLRRRPAVARHHQHVFPEGASAGAGTGTGLYCGAPREVDPAVDGWWDARRPAVVRMLPDESCTTPTPASPPARSTGCNAAVHGNAHVARGGRWVGSVEGVKGTVVRLDSQYFAEKDRAALGLTGAVAACGCSIEGVACAVCGNALGALHTPCRAHHHSRKGPTHYVFLPAAVSPSIKDAANSNSDPTQENDTRSPRRRLAWFSIDEAVPMWDPSSISSAPPHPPPTAPDDPLPVPAPSSSSSNRENTGIDDPANSVPIVTAGPQFDAPASSLLLAPEPTVGSAQPTHPDTAEELDSWLTEPLFTHTPMTDLPDPISVPPPPGDTDMDTDMDLDPLVFAQPRPIEPIMFSPPPPAPQEGSSTRTPDDRNATTLAELARARTRIARTASILAQRDPLHLHHVHVHTHPPSPSLPLPLPSSLSSPPPSPPPLVRYTYPSSPPSSSPPPPLVRVASYTPLATAARAHAQPSLRRTSARVDLHAGAGGNSYRERERERDAGATSRARLVGRRAQAQVTSPPPAQQQQQQPQRRFPSVREQEAWLAAERGALARPPLRRASVPDLRRRYSVGVGVGGGGGVGAGAGFGAGAEGRRLGRVREQEQEQGQGQTQGQAGMDVDATMVTAMDVDVDGGSTGAGVASDAAPPSPSIPSPMPPSATPSVTVAAQPAPPFPPAPTTSAPSPASTPPPPVIDVDAAIASANAEVVRALVRMRERIESRERVRAGLDARARGYARAGEGEGAEGPRRGTRFER